MPANLTPAYKTAEAAYKRARDPAEQLECLREMHRTIPKHKGTEHLRADIKTRMKELTEVLAGPRKGGTRTGPPTVIRREGAAQVALLGPPNTGKSTIHATLTGSHAEAAPYPFTTQYPMPGMLPVDDITIQLIDLPPISPQHPVPWIGNALQPADAALLVVDLSHINCVEETMALHAVLAERRVVLSAAWDTPDGHDDGDTSDDGRYLFETTLPTLLVATKADVSADLLDELEVFEELTGYSYPMVAVSGTSGDGLDGIGPWLFEKLGIVRVYTKIPGQPPDMGTPFTVRRGQTVLDVAELVHRDIAGSFSYARLWGAGYFDGQQVGADHPVSDGDVVELHAS
jgi:ribosome-interacting GTPase 1